MPKLTRTDYLARVEQASAEYFRGLTTYEEYLERITELALIVEVERS